MVEIRKQIQEWKNTSQKEDDFVSQNIQYLKEFQSLTNLEKYISHDAEGFYGITPYINLMKEIGEMIKPEVLISDIRGNIDDGYWEFNFKINGKLNEIEIVESKTDWINFEFIDQINARLTWSRIKKKLKIVYTTSINRRDQSFDLAFIDEITFDKLINHSPKYAKR